MKNFKKFPANNWHQLFKPKEKRSISMTNCLIINNKRNIKKKEKKGVYDRLVSNVRFFDWVLGSGANLALEGFSRVFAGPGSSALWLLLPPSCPGDNTIHNTRPHSSWGLGGPLGLCLLLNTIASLSSWGLNELSWGDGWSRALCCGPSQAVCCGPSQAVCWGPPGCECASPGGGARPQSGPQSAGTLGHLRLGENTVWGWLYSWGYRGFRHPVKGGSDGGRQRQMEWCSDGGSDTVADRGSDSVRYGHCIVGYRDGVTGVGFLWQR